MGGASTLKNMVGFPDMQGLSHGGMDSLSYFFEVAHGARGYCVHHIQQQDMDMELGAGGLKPLLQTDWT